MYTENAFGLRTKKPVGIVFEGIKRWDVIKKFAKDIPGRNCIREKAILVSI